MKIKLLRFNFYRLNIRKLIFSSRKISLKITLFDFFWNVLFFVATYDIGCFVSHQNLQTWFQIQKFKKCVKIFIVKFRLFMPNLTFVAKIGPDFPNSTIFVVIWPFLQNWVNVTAFWQFLPNQSKKFCFYKNCLIWQKRQILTKNAKFGKKCQNFNFIAFYCNQSKALFQSFIIKSKLFIGVFMLFELSWFLSYYLDGKHTNQSNRCL